MSKSIQMTDRHQIFSVGKTTAVDDQPEINFSIPLCLCHDDQSLMVVTTQHCAIAVSAVFLCLSVSPSVCHKPVLWCQNC